MIGRGHPNLLVCPDAAQHVSLAEKLVLVSGPSDANVYYVVQTAATQVRRPRAPTAVVRERGKGDPMRESGCISGDESRGQKVHTSDLVSYLQLNLVEETNKLCNNFTPSPSKRCY